MLELIFSSNIAPISLVFLIHFRSS